MNIDLDFCFCIFVDLGLIYVKEVFDMNNIMLDELCLVNWLCLFKRIDYVFKFFWVINF